MTGLQKEAHDLASRFEQGTRSDKSTFWKLKDNAWQGLREFVRECHGGSLPNDWLYKAIRDAFEVVSECDDPDECQEQIDSMVDIYDHDLKMWLVDYPDAQCEVDEVIKEYKPESLIQAIQMAQYNVYSSLVSRCVTFCRDQLADQDDPAVLRADYEHDAAIDRELEDRHDDTTR